MARDGLLWIQPMTEPVDIARWFPDEEFPVYPEGARDKRRLYSPREAVHSFVVTDHRYLFKKPPGRYPDQFWAEVAAYRIGGFLGVVVPPAFVAWNSRNEECGALIEWFLDYPGGASEHCVPGGDIMMSMDPKYDRRRGRRHNFAAVRRYMGVLEDKEQIGREWRTWWCDTASSTHLSAIRTAIRTTGGCSGRLPGRRRMAPAFDNPKNGS